MNADVEKARVLLAELRNQVMVLTANAEFVNENMARFDNDSDVRQAAQDAVECTPRTTQLCKELAAALGVADPDGT